MKNETLTLTLGGVVPFDKFTQAMRDFDRLVESLTKDIGKGATIDWLLDDLSSGSAVVTLRGISESPEAVARVSRAYITVGQSIETGLPIPYGPDIVRAAENLTAIVTGSITSIQFESSGEVAVVTGKAPRGEPPIATVGAHGSVEGRIETVTHRRWTGFVLYDLLNDQAIRCYLQPDQEDIVRDAWNRRAVVRGWIRRDPYSGRPVAVNPVHSIEIVEDIEPGAFLRARGISPRQQDDPTVEEQIRRLRDA